MLPVLLVFDLHYEVLLVLLACLLVDLVSIVLEYDIAVLSFLELFDIGLRIHRGEQRSLVDLNKHCHITLHLLLVEFHGMVTCQYICHRLRLEARTLEL